MAKAAARRLGSVPRQAERIKRYFEFDRARQIV
jgi:hypothetical protein